MSRSARAIVLLIVAVVLALAVFAPSRVSAANPVVVDKGVQDNFPNGMVFSVHAEGATISKIRLLYKILPDGTSAIARPDLTPANSVDTTITIGGQRNGGLYLPPGTVIDYQWEATDAAGNVSTTVMQTFFYNDIRFPWEKAGGAGVTIYYYSGSGSDAANMHTVALKAITDAEDLLGATVPFEVQVWLYANQDDMRPALQRTSPGFESQIITEGVKVSSNTVLILGTGSSDTLRHELTHIVTGQAGDSPLGHLPAWLNEGTAVHGQQDPGGYKDAVDAALANGNPLSVREITAYPGDASKIGIFYGEAWSLVTYLVDTYGKQKFATLYADIKAGKGVDKSFQLVYGFDQDGLDNAWRQSHGLPARATPAPTTAAPSSTPIATLAPVTSAGGGTDTTAVVAIVIAVVALASVVGLGGITLARRL